MDKQIITFTANEQHLHKTGGLDIFAAKTVSYIEAHFDLGQNWSGYDSIEAVWWNDRTRPIRTVLDTEGICVVPPEVLTKRGEVYVNLVGVISSGNVLTDRLTTHPITALTNKFNAQLGEGTTTPLTPSEYEQFVATVKADADRAEDAKDSARVYAGNALSSAQNALVSETNAGTSETNAHTSEVNAKASELNAETYKNQAQTYAQNADISATNAENAKDEAIDARDEILGMSATATTLPAGSNATASYSDGALSLGIPKGDKGDKGNTGDTGSPAGFGTVSATVDANIGTPSVEVTASGADTAKNFAFAFHNLKGQKGDKGDPGDVSQAQLDAAVSDLKSDFKPVNNELFSNSLISAFTSAEGWKLLDSGLCAEDSSYKLVKYKVLTGDVVKVKSDYKFQFQNLSSVPSSGTSNRVGKTYGEGEYMLKVPSGVTYLIGSTLKVGSSFAVYVATGIQNTKSAVKNGATEYTDIVQGTISSDGAISSSTRIRTEAIRVSAGDEIFINPGSLQYVVAIWEATISSSTNTRNDIEWRGGGETVEISADGYIMIAFRKADNSSISPSVYDGNVLSIGNQVYKNKANIERIEIYDSRHIPLESGGFTDADGVKKQNSYRIRNTQPIPLGNIDSIILPDGYDAYIYKLDANKDFIGSYNNMWKSWIIAASDFESNVKYINIAIRNNSTPNSDISGEISSVQAALKVVSNNDRASDDLNCTITTIKKADVEQGSWGYNSKSNTSIRIRAKNRISVKQGDEIFFDSNDLYAQFSVFANESSTSVLETTDWSKKVSYIIQHDGVATFNIANAATFGTSTAITIDDFDTEIIIQRNASALIGGIIDDYISEYLPSYYVNEINDTRNKLSALPSDNFNYIMITDIHYSHSDFTPLKLKQMMGSFRRIANGANIDAVLCLGDLIEGGKNASKTTSKNQISSVVDEFADIRKPVLFARGNHDDNAYDWWQWDDANKTTAYYLTLDEFNGMCERTFGNPSDVYAMDFPDKQMRIVIANTADYSEVIDGEDVSITKPSDVRITESQLDNIADMFYASQYDIVLGTHGLSEYLMGLIKTFNEHGTYTKSDSSSVSFAGKTQTVKLMHVGHYHNDAMEYNETYKVNAIATSCGSLAAVQQASTGNGSALLSSWEGSSATKIIDIYPRTKGTANEACFDVVSIGNGKITKIRFGAGSDGTLDI